MFEARYVTETGTGEIPRSGRSIRTEPPMARQEHDSKVSVNASSRAVEIGRLDVELKTVFQHVEVGWSLHLQPQRQVVAAGQETEVVDARSDARLPQRDAEIWKSIHVLNLVTSVPSSV